jgi:hypothetical protein
MAKRQFKVDDRVYFDICPEVNGFGTILGKSMEHIIDFYIVLLDKPINGQKAIVVPSPVIVEAWEKDGRESENPILG